MRKFAVVGVYGEGENFTTGQAVKCYEFITWLQTNYGNNEVKIVNTYNWKKNPIKLFFSLFNSFCKCENIIILPAQHGLKVFAPLCYYLKKVFKKKVQYIVIGGWLGETLQENKRIKKCVAFFDGIFVETHSMVNKIKSIGINNCYYLPNCRAIPKNIKRKIFNKKDIIKVCTYSRVVKEKGIADAIDIVNKANKILNKNIIQLDIYGKIANEFNEELNELLKKNIDTVSYRGVKKADEGVETLANYYCLLFPTYYEGEGFAGTILDAFAAATPVIANDWKYNNEIIKNEINGIIYSYRNTEEAANKLVGLYNDTLKYQKIQNECKKDSKQYTPDIVFNKFIKHINGEET